MCYANLVFARGAERFADELAQRGISGLIVPDLPLEEAGDTLAACDAAGVALVPLVAPTTPDERLAAIGARRARLRLHRLRDRHDRGARGAGRRPARTILARTKARTDVPVALGFGIGTPEAAAQAAAAGADGVIVGSRLVRAAAEAQEPASAVRELVARVRRKRSGRIRDRDGPAAHHHLLRSSLWIVLIAIGVKPFDALHAHASLMILVAATARVFGRFLPGSRGRATSRATLHPLANAQLTSDLLRRIRRDE